MDTASEPAPALVLLMMNSDWEPVRGNHFTALLGVFWKAGRLAGWLTGCRLTCGAFLQPGTGGRHQTGLSSLSRFSHSDLEGTSWDVAAVELDVDGVDAVLPGDEPDGVLVWTERDVCEQRSKYTNKVFVLPLTHLFPAR